MYGMFASGSICRSFFYVRGEKSNFEESSKAFLNFLGDVWGYLWDVEIRRGLDPEKRQFYGCSEWRVYRSDVSQSLGLIDWGGWDTTR